jgi:hypothetical protein
MDDANLFLRSNNWRKTEGEEIPKKVWGSNTAIRFYEFSIDSLRNSGLGLKI